MLATFQGSRSSVRFHSCAVKKREREREREKKKTNIKNKRKRENTPGSDRPRLLTPVVPPRETLGGRHGFLSLRRQDP